MTFYLLPVFKFVINFTHGFRLGLIDVTDYLRQIYEKISSTIYPARRCAEQSRGIPSATVCQRWVTDSNKRVVYLPWSTSSHPKSLIPARRNGRRGKPLMVIVTRGRGRIDTARCCVAFTRKSPSNNATACGLPRRQASPMPPTQLFENDKTARPRQRPGVIRPSTPAVKFARFCSPACTRGPRCVNAFSFQRQRAENHLIQGVCNLLGELRESRVLAVIHFCSSARDAARSASVPDDRPGSSIDASFPPMSDAG